MFKAKIDIPVLLIFFCREKPFSKVFEAVKKARPSKLYLYQDGAREGNESDKKGIEACRKIALDIDWECEVYTKFQEKNFGCDPSEFIAQKWFFDNEEMGIVLEDDDVPSQSFFPYCKELLEKYKDDDRIAIICGMNNYDVETSTDDSYFFTKRGSIWGWASWRRFIDLWDENYSVLDNPEQLKKLADYCDCEISLETYLKIINRHKDSGRAHYESIMYIAAATNNMLNIVPKYNMISNIGIDNVSTHSASDIRLLPKRTQKLMYKKTYEIEFPLKHPEKVERNRKYEKKYKISKFKKLCYRVEHALRVIWYGKLFKKK